MRRGAAAVVVGGAVVTALIAGYLRMPAEESVQLALIAASAGVTVGLAGALALWALRKSSLRTQIAATVLTSVGAVGLGAVTASSRMFISAHDLDVLFVVIATAATIGIATALVLGGRVADAVRELGSAARRYGGGQELSVERRSVPEELAELTRDLEEMSAKLDEARAAERGLESSRRELVAWVSHDLRTPLAGIRAMAEALEDGVVDDEASVARYHRAMRVEADRLAGLVEDLFELSRINSGTLQLEMESVSLEDLVSDSIAAAAQIAEVKGVRLEGRLSSAVPQLDLSAREMARVLRNLIENAIRHTPADGSVFVEAGTENERAYVSVADGCGGIPEEDLGRVFDVAFRGQAARTPGEDGGAGLGLAIARGIVEAHHGAIVVSNENGGCRFTVTLPLARS